ncbi:MAG: type II toxin-antitoxin system prevent-host-death family antitoxin [Actinomycetales bacterium]|nr:type II toxin-antitoxin system prevent-host-death family antitoxin [Actinomycetales bacterium]
MDVPVSSLRSQLKHWIERVGEGEEIVVTERGIPVARLTGVAGTDLLTSLERDGLISAPAAERPTATPPEGKVPAAAHAVSGLVRRLRR